MFGIPGSNLIFFYTSRPEGVWLADLGEASSLSDQGFFRIRIRLFSWVWIRIRIVQKSESYPENPNPWKKTSKKQKISSIFFSLHTYLALLTLSFLVRLLCNLVHASSDCECYAAVWAQAAAGGVRHLRGHADQVQELAAAVTAGRTRAGQAHEDWHQSHQASNTSHGEHFSLTFIDHGIGNEFFSFLRNWLFRMWNEFCCSACQIYIKKII